jgi:hypothetical protein
LLNGNDPNSKTEIIITLYWIFHYIVYDAEMIAWHPISAKWDKTANIVKLRQCTPLQAAGMIRTAALLFY